MEPGAGSMNAVDKAKTSASEREEQRGGSRFEFA